VRCGLGFIGKNTTLIHPKKGSFFFIGHLFLPIELEGMGKPLTNRCGRCTKCLDACPTGALEAPFHIDARKCISYLTIEYKGSLAGIDPKTFNGWMYGCDICQDVCPYNRFALPNREPDFQPSERLIAMHDEDWERLSKEDFDALFKHSAVQRAGYEGLKRNIDFISEVS
jgi:epoxyqueuosine reductase